MSTIEPVVLDSALIWRGAPLRQTAIAVGTMNAATYVPIAILLILADR